jgi:adenine-specific DNA-methyltransferase
LRQSRNSSIRLSWKKFEFDTEPIGVPGTRTKSFDENLLILADNLKAMKYLLLNGFKEKIDLVYIDPPFYTGASYYRRGGMWTDLAFKDKWSNQINLYMNMIYPRLSLIRSLLSVEGSIFVHLDWHASHYVKLVMDEIFGIENFRNEIIVKRGRRKNLLYQFEKVDRMHTANDIILWYSKYPSTKFSKPLVPADLKSKWMSFWSNTDRPTMRYKIFDSAPERGQWKWSKERATKAIQNYDLYTKKYEMKYPLEHYWEEHGRILEFIRKRSTVKYPEYWIPPKTSKIIDTLWLDIESYNYSTGFSTEKHNALLERVIGLFSKPSSIVSDLFCGSGTALVAAEKLGRRWIGCDASEVALNVVKERLGKSKYNFVTL